MKTRVIYNLNKQNEIKTGVSYTIPVRLKEKLQFLADKNNTSVNSIIIEMIELFFRDDEKRFFQFLLSNKNLLDDIREIFIFSDDIENPLYLKVENILSENNDLLKDMRK